MAPDPRALPQLASPTRAVDEPHIITSTATESHIDPDDVYVTIGRACLIASVSRRTLYLWMANGKVHYLRTAGGRRRIRQADLLQVPRQVPRQVPQ